MNKILHTLHTAHEENEKNKICAKNKKVTQKPQIARPRNTNNMRGRLWAMTLNNYMETEIKSLQELDDCQFIFQEEIGKENKVPHLQGFFKFKQPKTLTAMKKINRRAHWEIGLNEFALKQYCQKADTRNGKIYTNIEIEVKNEEITVNCKKNKSHISEEIREDIAKNLWKYKVIDEMEIYNISIEEAIQKIGKFKYKRKKDSKNIYNELDEYLNENIE